MSDNEEKLWPYALTTSQRVKDLIGKQGTGQDQVINRLINAATDFIEGQCNGRRFVLTKYLNDVQSSYGYRQSKLILRQCPVFYLVITGNTSAGSNQVTNCSGVLSYGSGAGSSIANIQVGMPIMWGDNGDPINQPQLSLPQGVQTTVTNVNGTTLTLSRNATATITGAIFLVHGLIAAQYRAGPPSAPSWTNFVLDQFELVNNGQSGTVRIYGAIPRLYNNMIRATYWAGYVTDFDNFGNPALHALPADLTFLCEKLVVRFWTRRDFAGKNAETLAGATITFKDNLDKEDLMTLGKYRMPPPSF